MTQSTNQAMPVFIRDWIEALRSGEYQQDSSFLQTSLGYCCLGVFCDVAEKKGYASEIVRTESGKLVGTDLDSQGNFSFLSRAFLSKLTIEPDKIIQIYNEHIYNPNSYHPDITGLKTPQSLLIRMNDKWKFSFAQIADVLENHWADLLRVDLIPEGTAGLEIVQSSKL